MPFLSPLFTLRDMLNRLFTRILAKTCMLMYFFFIYSSMHKKTEESSIQYSHRVDVAVCVRALQMCVCVCVCALQMCVCACASDVCVCVRFRCVRALQMCVCVCVCVCVLQMCVCACASDVCVRFRCVCVCVCVRFRCVHGKLLTQRSTVTPTILSILYARLVPSGSPYIESWYVRLNENARIGGNA